MGYTNNEAMVRVDFFKPSGKWYATEAILWTGEYRGQLIHDAFKQALRDGLDANQYRGFDAICLEPYHEHAHPICIKDGGWIE